MGPVHTEERAHAMEPTGISGDRPSVTQVYRCFQAASRPTHSPADVAAVIYTGVCGREPAEDRKCAASPAQCHHDNTSMSVSLVERMVSSVSSPGHRPPVASYYREILRVLFEDMDLMTQLVHLFQSDDQIVSHLSAKCSSTCVVHQLQQTGAVSPVWQQTCVQAFLSSSPGPELDSCLWSLTDVMKRLMKGDQQENLVKLLETFDSSLSVLFAKFFPEENEEVMRDRSSSSKKRGTTLCLLLDLLEVLTASGLTCGAGVCLKSQRITYTHSSALLKIIGCSSSPYYVKKRVMLLLKRVVLQKAGEDWALGEPLPSGGQHENYSCDMRTLAHSVLAAVSAGWLQSVEVESDSFFGGVRRVRGGGDGGDGGQTSDCVMLRAVSLLLLKSAELHVQTADGTAGGDGPTEVYGFLQRLWGFLQSLRVHLPKVTHLCCWVSLLCGEQDDDMMEAAKALLNIFLHHHRQSSGPAVLEASCSSGLNPHCHFLLLLQTVSFDHSILLDFLISTETCFLEYFVRYLKYLLSDWPGFTTACGRISSSRQRPSPQKPLSPSYGGDVSEPKHEEPDRDVLSGTGSISAEEVSVLAAGLRLVDYGSSEESDQEDMEVSQEVPSGNKGLSSSLSVKEDTEGPKLPETNSPLERQQQGASVLCPSVTPLSGPLTLDPSVRAILCLSKLKEVVKRLQTKKLFPYNPSSLLRLLTQVEDCYKQSQPSFLNK